MRSPDAPLRFRLKSGGLLASPRGRLSLHSKPYRTWWAGLLAGGLEADCVARFFLRSPISNRTYMLGPGWLVSLQDGWRQIALRMVVIRSPISNRIYIGSPKELSGHFMDRIRELWWCVSALCWVLPVFAPQYIVFTPKMGLTSFRVSFTINRTQTNSR